LNLIRRKYREAGENYIMRSFMICTLPNITTVTKSRGIRWAGHVTRMGEVRNVYKILVGKPEGKRPFGKPRCRWEHNTKRILRLM
jgi:hypothetical protein